MKISHIISAVCALALSATLLISCAKDAPDAPDGMKLASPDQVDYYLYVPEDWQINTKEGSILTEACVSVGDSSNITMMSFANDKADDYKISDYWSDYEKKLSLIFDLDENGNSTYNLKTPEKTDDNGNTVAAGDKGTLGGKECYSYRYTGTVGGVPLEYLQVITEHKGYFYIFTYTATTEGGRFERNEESVAEILYNFKFAD